MTKLLRKIDDLKGHFGDLKVNRGKTHDFLGMKISFNNDKSISLDMKDQVREAIDTFGEEFKGEVPTAAARSLHNVDEKAAELDQELSEKFHSVVAKLLYIAKRARPDIETAVSFLCTRVSKSTVEDYEKLRRVVHYLQSTIEDVRKIGAKNGMSFLFTWIDAAYAVHPDMKSQTGGCMSFGTGILHGKSGKQKLNVKALLSPS